MLLLLLLLLEGYWLYCCCCCCGHMLTRFCDVFIKDVSNAAQATSSSSSSRWAAR
jgi:hypothetical protein